MNDRQTRFFPRIPTTALTLALTAVGTLDGAATAGIVETTIFRSGIDGYNTYRIPVIIAAANGDLLAFAEGRESLSDAGEIDIVMKRSTNLGASWGPLEVVQDSQSFANLFAPGSVPPLTAGNPAPVVDRLDTAHPGRIWLPFSLENERAFVTHSDDHGATWSSATEITSTVKNSAWDWYATGPVHGIQLTRGPNAGRLIIPSDHTDGSAYGAHVVYSDDHGQSWHLGAFDTQSGGSPVHPNENVAVELVDGRIYFNARDQNGSSPETRAVAFSSNGGLTYDAPFAADPQITTPVVQNSVLRLAAVDQGDAQNVLVYSGPGQPDGRSDMTLRLSLDEGLSWTKNTVVHPGPAAYSDLVSLGSLKIGVLFETGAPLYSEIVFGSVSFAELNPSPWNGVTGDVDQDGGVDEQDLDAFVGAWNPAGNERFFGGSDSYRHGDLNFDGFVSLLDVMILRQALLAHQVSPARLELLSVPEPAAWKLSLVGFAIYFPWRRRRA